MVASGLRRRCHRREASLALAALQVVGIEPKQISRPMNEAIEQANPQLLDILGLPREDDDAMPVVN